MDSQTPASLFCTWTRCAKSCAAHDSSPCFTFSTPDTCSCDACLCQPLMLSRPQSARWSMYDRSSSQVITPGVESGSTKSGQVHCGYACTSLHMDSQMPASLFCSWTRRAKSCEAHAFSPCFTLSAPVTWSCDACLCQPLMLSRPQSASWSMYDRSSSHVITPGVESGSTKPGQEHCGYAFTSLHMFSQMPASA